MERDLICKGSYCEDCSIWRTLISDISKRFDKCIFRCSCCRSRVSVRANSFFYQIRKPLRLILTVLYFWCARTPVTTVLSLMNGETWTMGCLRTLSFIFTALSFRWVHREKSRVHELLAEENINAGTSSQAPTATPPRTTLAATTSPTTVPRRATPAATAPATTAAATAATTAATTAAATVTSAAANDDEIVESTAATPTTSVSYTLGKILIDYYNFFRDICTGHFHLHPVSLGGVGTVVQIDESKLGRRKICLFVGLV